MNYDTYTKIDDARYEASKAEEALDAAQDALGTCRDKLESLAYIFSETLKQLGSETLKQAGYGPAKAITEKNCVEFFDGLIERHCGEDDVVEAIVEGLKPVDSEVPFEASPYIQHQDLYDVA